MLDVIMLGIFILSELVFIIYVYKSYRLNLRMPSTMHLFAFCSFSVTNKITYLLSYYLKFLENASEFIIISYAVELFLISIFFLKKFVFDNYLQERLICYLLSIVVLTTFLCTANIRFPSMGYSKDLSLVDYLFGNFFIGSISTLIPQIPTFLILAMWVFSVCKKFDSLKLMFYPKSINSSILWFLLYAFILSDFNFVKVTTTKGKFIVLISICLSRVGLIKSLFNNLKMIEQSTKTATDKIREINSKC